MLDLSSTDREVRNKLKLVLDAHSFASQMGLKPGRSYTSYSPVSKSPLVYVITASRPDSFQMHTWWYPFVGSVPYKGYFKKDQAERAAKVLARSGYEVRLGGADAFSTLGWFNDPLLSTVVAREESRVVNTVLHEMLHTTIWLRGSVDFNESLANFVGFQGAIDFFKDQLSRCEDDQACTEQFTSLYNRSLKLKEMELHISEVVRDLYYELKELYASDLSSEDKIAARGVIFEKHVEPLHRAYPGLNALKEVNNAEIMQLRIYTKDLTRFEALFEMTNRLWPRFLEEVETISVQSTTKGLSPFAILEEMILQNNSSHS
jgi:predicted aminopeptidase